MTNCTAGYARVPLASIGILSKKRLEIVNIFLIYCYLAATHLAHFIFMRFGPKVDVAVVVCVSCVAHGLILQN